MSLSVCPWPIEYRDVVTTYNSYHSVTHKFVIHQSWCIKGSHSPGIKAYVHDGFLKHMQISKPHLAYKLW